MTWRERCVNSEFGRAHSIDSFDAAMKPPVLGEDGPLWNRSYALETDEAAIRRWTIAIAIERAGKTVFSGSTRVDQIKRRFDELAAWLGRSQRFPHGVVLLTGTGVVPDESFTLAPGDRIAIRIDGCSVPSAVWVQ